jgi:hypothetical protein
MEQKFNKQWEKLNKDLLLPLAQIEAASFFCPISAKKLVA